MTPRLSRLRRRSLGVVATALSLAALLALSPGPASALASAQAGEDPNLGQTIDRDQSVVSGEAVLDDGHVDIGPRLVDGRFTLLVHDDSVIPSVWRHLDDTVMHVGDDALQTVPDDPTYSFLGAVPGTAVYVVPQVQRPGVVWVGWNTQDPAVMETIDRGATLTLLGVEGPGELTMYLQSGVLGDPEVLWRSTVAEAQPIWVEVNTHTHANWVFTEPGVYLVQVEMAADLVNGESVSDVRTLRFAIGDATSPVDALGVELSAVPAEPTPPATEAVVVGDDPPGDGRGPLVAAIVGVGAVLVVAVARGAGAKRRAERERATASSGGLS